MFAAARARSLTSPDAASAMAAQYQAQLAKYGQQVAAAAPCLGAAVPGVAGGAASSATGTPLQAVATNSLPPLVSMGQQALEPGPVAADIDMQ